MKLAPSVFALILVACGGSVAGSGADSGTTSPDSGTTMPVDAGGPPDASMPEDSGTDSGVAIPAWHPPAPQVISYGGGVLQAPTIIPVFYASDPLQSKVEQMLQGLPQSTYWTAISKEYGVGAISIASSIVLNDTPPSKIDDSEIATWLGTNVDGTHAPWPKADGSQIYAIFYPQSTVITLQGSQSCYGFGAYHEESITKIGLNFPYAVMPRCGGGMAIDSLTVAVSHEIIEAATDPFVQSTPAYQAVDFDHYTWAFFPGGEVGDMCAFERQAEQKLVGNFMVQRSWSNVSAKASHDPCVPALAQPYFNSAPDFKDKIKLNFGGGGVTTKGMKIPIGQSGTVDVYLFADAPTGPWNVEAVDAASFQGQNPELSFEWDKTTGQNGDVLHLKVTALQASNYGVSLFVIRSDQNGIEHLWYGAVVNN
jgi:hypothetical protein